MASTTKGATAICAHLLVQRGELDLDAPVVKYWPEFGAAGREKIPVRWLLSHQAGLPIVDGPLTFEVSEVDGSRLFDPVTVERMTVVQTDRTRMNGLPPGLNIPADRSFYMSLGFWRSCRPMPWVGPTSFGHPGSGGSVGFADIDAGVGIK